MRLLSKITAALFLLAALYSCIQNDLDYPVVQAGITDFKVGLQKSVKIDPAARTVVVDLEETADMAALEVETFTYTEGASASKTLFGPPDRMMPAGGFCRSSAAVVSHLIISE